MYDVIVIGAGIAGAVVARQFATNNKKVLIIEKRNHIGGNCYDYIDEYGVLVHKYGPHIFHTNSERVYKYLSEFTQWYPYHHEVAAYIDGKYIPVPFNLHSLKEVYSKEKEERIKNKLIHKYGMGNKVPILQLMQDGDEEIKELAKYVYENVFLHYTMKQWGQKPEEIDQSVTARVPVLVSQDDGYFQDLYQGMPKDGYTKMFENMLNHENITVRLNTDAKDVIKLENENVYFENELFENDIIFTGAIDEFMELRYGRLPYRSLDFLFEHFEKDSYQPKAVVNYTVSEAFTRITEFKKLTGQKINSTTIVKEYSMEYNGENGQIPYYAILNDDNISLYEKYKGIIDGYNNVHLLGRLAQYRYFNIDAIALEALNLVDELLNL